MTGRTESAVCSTKRLYTFVVACFALSCITACDDTSSSCVDLTCGDHEVCMMVAGSATCVCDTGYTGDGCDECEPGYSLNDDGECESSSGSPCDDLNCGSNGDCDDSSGSAICDCDTGWTGTTCDECDTGFVMNDDDECIPDGGCDDDPCGDHGTCDDSSGEVECICDDGYMGTVCDECSPGFHDDGTGTCISDEVCGTNTCNGHGSCDDSSGEVLCTCDEGYAGDNCEGCDEGFHPEGDDCVSDICPVDFCNGHGTCSVEGGEPVCECEEEYGGDTCAVCAEGYAESFITGLCELACPEGREFIRCGDECVYGMSQENCGGCGVECLGDSYCDWRGGEISCACYYDTCPDGTCADLNSDINNCGECGNACDGGSEICFFGTCQVSTGGCDFWCEEEGYGICCPGGWCLYWEEAYRDPENCGGCGIECGPDESCVYGTCMEGTCDLECWEGSICCEGPWGDQCVDPGYDTENCGGCGIECVAGERCEGGRCTCRSPSVRCGDACIDVSFDNVNCGECGNVCDIASGERCLYGICEPGESECSGCSDEQLCCEDSYEPGDYECVGVEEMRWNPEHCGGCEPCIAGEECWNGTCQCYGEFSGYCGDPPVCTDLWSNENCGECGNVCEGDEVCEYSEWGWVPDCLCFYDECDGLCTNLESNEADCGECGNECEEGEVCITGNCIAPTSDECREECREGSLCCADPDGGPAQCVYEWDFRRSDDHCGSCGNQCADDESCINGECRIPPGDTCDDPIETGGGFENDLCEFNDTTEFETGELCPEADGGIEAFHRIEIWESGEHQLWFGTDEMESATLFLYLGTEEDGCEVIEPLACISSWGETRVDLEAGDNIYAVVFSDSDVCGWYYFEIWGGGWDWD